MTCDPASPVRWLAPTVEYCRGLDVAKNTVSNDKPAPSAVERSTGHGDQDVLRYRS